MSSRIRFALLCVVALLGISCLWVQSGPARQDEDAQQVPLQSSAVSTEVDPLMTVVQLKYEPLTVTWQQHTIGDGFLGPADHHLKAVVTYEPEIIKKIESAAIEVESSGTIAGEVFPGAPFVEAWFPDSVLAHLTPSADDPDLWVVDVPMYALDSLGGTIWADGFFFIADEQTIFVFCNTR